MNQDLNRAPRILRFEVFGRRIDVEATVDGWTAFFPGDDGKRRPAHISVPSELKDADDIVQYFDDLFHESANAKHPNVKQLFPR